MSFELNISVPDKLSQWSFTNYRYVSIYGGRGSAKSRSVAQDMVKMSYEQESDPFMLICARQKIKSIEKSSYRLIKWAILKLGVKKHFKITKTEIVNLITGNEFVFVGLHDPNALDSLEGAKYFWLDEANISEETFNQIDPTLRAYSGCRMIFTFNPKKQDAFVCTRLMNSDDPDTLCIEMNWKDNPWFPEHLNYIRKKMLKANKALHNHIWEGEFLKDGQLAIWHQNNFQIIDSLPLLDYVEIVADTASKDNPNNDDSAFLVVGLSDDHSLVIIDCIKLKAEINLLKQSAIRLWNKHRKETISTVKAPASVMAIEDQSSGTQLLQMLKGYTEINVEAIKRRVSAKELGDDVPQELKKWKRAVQAQQEIIISDRPIKVIKADWNSEFLDDVTSIEMYHDGSEPRMPKRGKWDIADTLSDAVYRNLIKKSSINAGFQGFLG